MGLIHLLVAMLALYLFLLFLAQLFLLVWRLFWDRLEERRSVYDSEPYVREDPNSVEPIGIVDHDEFRSVTETWKYPGRKSTQLGRDRFNRLIHKVEEPDGRVSYYYWDRVTHERQRMEARRRKEAKGSAYPKADEPRAALGWKGFTADSSPWEVLGVARDASIAQIKAAYRKLIAKYHPDRFSNLTDPEIEQLERDAKLINAAYAKLVKS